MSYALIAKAFPLFERKYAWHDQTNPISIGSLVSLDSAEHHMPQGIVTKENAEKIRVHIRQAQLKQQIISDRMTLDSAHEIDFSHDIDSICVSIENLNALTGALQDHQYFERRHQWMINQDSQLRLKVVSGS